MGVPGSDFEAQDNLHSSSTIMEVLLLGARVAISDGRHPIDTLVNRPVEVSRGVH